MFAALENCIDKIHNPLAGKGEYSNIDMLRTWQIVADGRHGIGGIRISHDCEIILGGFMGFHNCRIQFNTGPIRTA